MIPVDKMTEHRIAIITVLKSMLEDISPFYGASPRFNVSLFRRGVAVFPCFPGGRISGLASASAIGCERHVISPPGQGKDLHCLCFAYRVH